MRLIDADALLERESYFADRDFITPEYDDTLRDIIDRAPAVDAEPVHHGRWIDDNCSECGQYVYHGDARNYCPNCGARMDGGKDNG